MRSFSSFILLFLFCAALIAQKDSDTSLHAHNSDKYYTDYSDLITLKPFVLFKQNKLAIQNGADQLLLSPNSPTGVGAGINYKSLGLSLGFGLPHSGSSIDKYGSTKRLDLQISLFMKNIGLDGHLQLYKAYYNENPNDFMDWTESYYPKLPGMKTISIGASGYYVLNNKRYSNKAAVMRTQKQNKSAGSFLVGIFINYDEADSPNGFFPAELPDTLGEDFDLKAFRYFATGITFGYAYTFVISKNFFIHAAVTPGGGYKDIRVENNAGTSDAEKQAHAQLQLRGALGYENKYFFAGLTGSTLIRNIKYKNYELNLSTDQIRVFVGYRFNPGKK